MRRWIFLTLLGLLQRHCTHPPETTSYDITEGDGPLPIGWCRICGAYRNGPRDAPGSKWNPCRADWWRKPE